MDRYINNACLWGFKKMSDILIDIITNSWNNCKIEIQEHIVSINSERCLQSLFYCNLKSSVIDCMNIAIEPKLIVNNKTCIPDILITNNHIIAAIIEIKFVPEGFANYKQDVLKLDFIKQNCLNRSFNIFIDPLSGRYDGEYCVSNDTIYCYAVIANNLYIHNYKNIFSNTTIDKEKAIILT